MIALIIGGSGSGKSSYAERIAVKIGQGRPLYYLATMQIYDNESQKKVEKHKKMRRDKGFFTIECAKNISSTINEFESGGTVLLECLSNLVANEMFSPDNDFSVNSILDDIKAISKKAENLIIVSNNVFEDGIIYDELTEKYISMLGEINVRLAKIADEVVEVVVSIPLVVKGENGICHQL